MKFNLILPNLSAVRPIRQSMFLSTVVNWGITAVA